MHLIETFASHGTQALGVLGFLGYLFAFAGLQFGFIDGNGRTYCLLNIVSATLVLISLYDAFNLASALIQISWITIGLGGLALRFYAKRVTKRTKMLPKPPSQNAKSAPKPAHWKDQVKQRYNANQMAA